MPEELVWAHSQVQGVLLQTTMAGGQIGKGVIRQLGAAETPGAALGQACPARSIFAGNPQPDRDRSFSSLSREMFASDSVAGC